MAYLLAVPFRLAPNGSAVSVEQGTDEYFRQQMTTIISTMRGERPINTDFGMPDMAFMGFMAETFYSQVSEHLPEIEGLRVAMVDRSDIEQGVMVEFDTQEP